MKCPLDFIQEENNMSTKANTLQKKKLLRAVRNRNTKVSNHNFATKTLKKVEPILSKDTQQVRNTKIAILEENKRRKIERGVK